MSQIFLNFELCLRKQSLHCRWHDALWHAEQAREEESLLSFSFAPSFLICAMGEKLTTCRWNQWQTSLSILSRLRFTCRSSIEKRELLLRPHCCTMTFIRSSSVANKTQTQTVGRWTRCITDAKLSKCHCTDGRRNCTSYDYYSFLI